MTEDSSEFTVAGIGELLWDLLPEGKQIGGAPANFAFHAAALGARSYVVTAVGDDDDGRELCRKLVEYGVDDRFVARIGGHSTGLVSVDLDGNGIPQYRIHDNVAWDFMESDAGHLELAAETDAVCFGTLGQRSGESRKTIRSFLAATRPDCLRIFDINLRQAYYDETIIRQSLRHSNVVKLNESELGVLGNVLSVQGTPEDRLKQLMERFDLVAAALTRGDRGCLVSTENQTVDHPGFPLGRIGDTVGAGDCFAASLALGLLRNEPLETICERANRRAAFVCTQPGAMPEMT